MVKHRSEAALTLPSVFSRFLSDLPSVSDPDTPLLILVNSASCPTYSSESSRSSVESRSSAGPGPTSRLLNLRHVASSESVRSRGLLPTLPMRALRNLCCNTRTPVVLKIISRSTPLLVLCWAKMSCAGVCGVCVLRYMAFSSLVSPASDVGVSAAAAAGGSDGPAPGPSDGVGSSWATEAISVKSSLRRLWRVRAAEAGKCARGNCLMMTNNHESQ
mmetsp:Transcript_12758/g.30031  ORF Transcript_12758/g.30031 Transcript_12758/m.30031 type:complete len:217 (+) Transcript_12758:258-908(+)